jgi:phosphate transport system permease protein
MSSNGKNSQRTIDIVNKGLAKRYRKERHFQICGLAAITATLIFLCVLLISIVRNGYSAFRQTFMMLDVYIDPEHVNRENIVSADYSALIRKALQEMFPDVRERTEQRLLNSLVSSGAGFQLQAMVRDNPALVGQKFSLWVPANDDVDMLFKGHFQASALEEDRPVNNLRLGWIDRLTRKGRMELRFNTAFFVAGDSREPELAGIRGAVAGSFFTLVVTLLLSFPLGVAAAVYLEEFAPRNRWTDLIEVNINNLAAVPSIVFGLLGLAVFLNFFQLPRSAPVVGGLVLALMTFPTIIIASRASLKAVPPSIREAALGVGASKMQTVMHHVLPLALPGMLTGTIIGMARALGETAPLLMIGMVAFIVDIPRGFTDPAAALPVQIYLWADSPERAFVEKTSAAIMVLLVFMIVMNSVAVYLRKRFERRW